MDENSEGCSEEIDNAIEQPDLVSDAVNDPIAEEPKDDSQKA
jgi:E3 ubiquitin-protein ligase UHRF1